jgi:predicted nucleic acid-binding protein
MRKAAPRRAPRRLALDTSAYSHFRAGHPLVIDWIAKAEIVLLPTTVLGELEAGFLIGKRREENQVALTDFLREPFVAVLPVTQTVAEVYGRVFASLRKAGTPISSQRHLDCCNRDRRRSALGELRSRFRARE